MTQTQMLFLAAVAWGSGLGLTLSLYSLLGLMRLFASPTADERMTANRTALTLSRPQIGHPLGPVTPPHRNGKGTATAFRYARSWPATRRS